LKIDVYGGGDGNAKGNGNLMGKKTVKLQLNEDEK